MISRRLFLALAGCASMMAAQQKGGKAMLRPACQTNAWRLDPNNFDQFLATLRHIRSLGYQGFETSFRNLQGQFSNAEAARSRIKETGLAITGVHIFLTQFDRDTALPPMDLIKQVAEGSARLGADRVILSGRGVTESGKLDEAALSRKVAALNAAAEYIRKCGLRTAYHNHGAEFTAGGAEIQALIERTPADKLDLFADAGHIFRAKADVVQFFNRHHARIAAFHFRDFKGNEQVPLGQGDVDLRPLVAAMRRMNWSGWVMNEEERENDGRPGDAAVVPARESLKKIFGV